MEIDYGVLNEREVTYVDKFYFEVAESTLSLDSDYLVNFAWAMSRIRPLFENKMSRVHPLFMKQSICSVKDSEVEQVNQEDSLSFMIERSMVNSQSKVVSENEKAKAKNASQLLTTGNTENDLEDPLLLPMKDYDDEDNAMPRNSERDFMALTKAR